MQTFLPYPDFKKTAQCLDYKRLGKQRVESFQILLLIDRIKRNDIYKENGKKIGWINHPAVLQWIGYERALKEYLNICIFEWINRGYNNTIEIYNLKGKIKYPKWLGNEEFHASHRSNLLRKDHEFYSRYNWKEQSNLPYVWCVKNKELAQLM